MKGLVTAAAIAAVLVGASPAYAGDEAAARAAARRGADWLRGLQQANGSGLGGFGLTALAAGGVHPADVAVGNGPSAQERAQADWAAAGAGPRGTDLARSMLAAHAAGIDPTLIAAERNFVAETLALFDGRRLYDPGAASSLSDDIFGTLGLAAVGAPQPILDALATFLRSQQTATGGWNFTEGAVNASVDMTGAGVGALCAAGVPVSDPAVAKALAFLRERQDPVTAGWGQNSDTAGWVVSGLRLCREDLTTWTRNGRDPLDDLMSRQLPSGGFRWRDTDTTENALATLDSVRPLGGAGFTADPPGGRMLAPPEVPDGTEVAVGVVVDYGVAVRACAVRARTGAPLESAITSASCVSEWGTGTWTVAHRDGSDVVRAGDVISLKRTFAPAVAPLPGPAAASTARAAQITRVVRRAGKLVITTSGAARIGVARVINRRCRPVRKNGRLGKLVTCGESLSMLPGPRLELKAAAGRYLILADRARLVVTLGGA